jgi:hypothetical protein
MSLRKKPLHRKRVSGCLCRNRKEKLRIVTYQVVLGRPLVLETRVPGIVLGMLHLYLSRKHLGNLQLFQVWGRLINTSLSNGFFGPHCCHDSCRKVAQSAPDATSSRDARICSKGTSEVDCGGNDGLVRVDITKSDSGPEDVHPLQQPGSAITVSTDRYQLLEGHRRTDSE